MKVDTNEQVATIDVNSEVQNLSTQDPDTVNQDKVQDSEEKDVEDTIMNLSCPLCKETLTNIAELEAHAKVHDVNMEPQNDENMEENDTEVKEETSFNQDRVVGSGSNLKGVGGNLKCKACNSSFTTFL